jgi:hypothetical protein
MNESIRADLDQYVNGWADESTRRAMLRFAKAWYHFGGGESEDIFMAFGISVSEFCRRLVWLIENERLSRTERTLRGPVLETYRALLYELDGAPIGWP